MEDIRWYTKRTGERRMRKQIPNILTSIRILCSLLLLVCQPFSSAFIWLYVTAGVSDMLDGFTARHFHAVSSFGEKYDSLADIIFVGVCLLKLLPVIHLPLWSILWIVLIVAVKALNLWLSYVYHRNKLFLHTIANKITGVMLFLTPLALIWIKVDFVLPIVCAVATFAAIQEGHYIRTGKTEEV